MKQVHIKIKDLSPAWIKIISVLIFLATGYKLITGTFFEVSPLVYIIFNTIAVAAWAGQELVIIDMDAKTIREGFKILGIGKFERTRFSGIEKIFINKVNTVGTFRHLTRTIDVHDVSYKAFLKTYEGDKICIGISSDKDKLIDKLKEYNKDIKTDIFDTTSYAPVQVA
jgi:hypothetical protein